MAQGFKLTRFLESGELECKQIIIGADGDVSIGYVPENFTPLVPSYPDWSQVFDLSPCFKPHNLNLDEYIGDLKREAMSVKMRNGKKNIRSPHEIARMDQVFVMGILNSNPEYMARKDTGNALENENAMNDRTVTIEILQDNQLMPPPSTTKISGKHRESKSSRRSQGRKSKKNKKDKSEKYRNLYNESLKSVGDPENSMLYNLSRSTTELRQSRRNSTTTTAAAAIAAATAVRQEERVWRCGMCGRVFPDQHQISNHILIEHHCERDLKMAVTREKSQEDMVIDDAVGDNSLIAYDARNEKETEREIDFLTDSEFVDKYTEELSAISLLQCEFCESVFTDTGTLFAHTKCHRAEKNYECLNCKRVFSSHGQAIAHWQAECSRTKTMSTFSLHKYLMCNICERKFIGWEQLYNHRYKNRHLSIKLYGPDNVEVHQCDQCNTTSETYQLLMDHRSKSHPRSLRAAEIAKRNHGQRSFLCEICGKAYTQSSHLWQHLRFHQGIKPFACTEPGCGRKFTIRPDLNDHIRKSHTGERPFHCTECDKRFLTGSVYYQHRLIHRGDRRYACQQCDKRFYRADALKNHVRIHSGEKPYRCPVCDRCFRQRGDRDKHLKVRHGHLDESGHYGNGQDSPGPLDQQMYIRNLPAMFPMSMYQFAPEHNVGEMY
ncbi:testis-specific zinc finger protein topi-like [Ctenocephalides felis]|uniref:testis-specific zinc finger protein topi-like n=1 Tax=Ctenocephalides felis TaxID=7515 RepID=UPI000E6E519D|nr:testis-specific zinc finger protein topi-like [Ctenocephalides felis]